MLQTLFDLPKEELEALLKLQTMVMTPHPSEIGVLSLVSQTRENVDSVLDRAAEIYHQYHDSKNTVPYVILNDAKGHPAVRPSNQIRSDLFKRGIPDQHIRTIVIPEDGGPPINTYTEMIAVLDWLSKHHLHRVGIVAPAFHQLRSMISMLSAQQQSKNKSARDISFVSIPAPVAWNEKSIHSQGILSGTRHEFILTELERVAAYHLKGDLIAPSQALQMFLAQ